MIAQTIGIVGVGTIGGSIGLRARRNGARVLAYDCDSAALTQALAAGAIDAPATIGQLTRRADTIVLCAHLEPTLEQLVRLQTKPKLPAALILDVASVKTPVVVAARGLRSFVATHPLAGSERHGVQAARADLFDGRVWAYVPSGDGELDQRAARFISSMGSRPTPCSAEDHDRAVALTSHLPQLIGACYARLVRDREPGSARLRGPVANELLRLSGMSFAMWRDILRANAHNVEPELRRLSVELLAAADALAEGKTSELERLFPALQAS